MNRRFLAWAFILILSLIGSGLCIRALALNKISLADGLISRGLASLIVVVIWARVQKYSLLPISPRTQAVRALLAGLALTFFTLSYNWLSASAIAVLSNIDVPLLFILGSWVGISSRAGVRWSALASIGCLVWYVSLMEPQAGLFYGLTTLMVGTVLLCFGYFFIKKSMNEENRAVTILTPSLALMFYGLLQKPLESGVVSLALDANPTRGGLELSSMSAGSNSTAISWGFESSFSPWTLELALIALLSGFCMFAAYYATMKLYESADLATAEFPTLLSSIAIQPFESLLLGARLESGYLLSSTAFVALTFLLLTWHHRTPAVQRAGVSV